MTETNVTLLVAVISAAVALYGYFYEKRKERESVLAATRREIYQRLINNLYQRQTLGLLNSDPNVPSIQKPEVLYPYLAKHHPDLWNNVMEALEINALLCIYGTDEAVKKASLFSLQSANYFTNIANNIPTEQSDLPDLPGLVLTLRQSVYGNSHESKQTMVTTEEIGQLLTP